MKIAFVSDIRLVSLFPAGSLLLSWANSVNLWCAVFWNNRRILGSCLCSLGSFSSAGYHHYMMMITQAKDSHISIFFWGNRRLCILLGFPELSQIFPLLLSLCSTFAYLPHNPRHCPPVHLWIIRAVLSSIFCVYIFIHPNIRNFWKIFLNFFQRVFAKPMKIPACLWYRSTPEIST